MADVTFDAAHFDALYRSDPDPWKFRTSTYEHEKYAATVAALPRDRYTHLLELGSSIGELTSLLAARATRVTGVETSAVAIAVAEARCASLPNVSFRQAHLPGGDWGGIADAVVLSEVLYYLPADDVDRVAARLAEQAAGADIVLVHWTGPTNYPLSGDDAAERFIRAYPDCKRTSTRTDRYRLDVLEPAMRA